MKKRFLNLLLSLGICLICVACSGRPVSATDKGSSDVRTVSRAYFMENCGYTEDDLVGVDIDEFINVFQVTEEYMQTEEFKTILSEEIQQYNEIKAFQGKYSYLLKTPLKKYEKSMLDNIRVFYVKDVYLGNTNIILFDFADERICTGPYLSYRRNTVPDDRKKLQALISASEIENITDTDQKKEIENGQEWLNSYELIIETYSGETAHLKGTNVEVPEYRALVGKDCQNIRGITERKISEQK